MAPRKRQPGKAAAKEPKKSTTTRARTRAQKAREADEDPAAQEKENAGTKRKKDDGQPDVDPAGAGSPASPEPQPPSKKHKRADPRADPDDGNGQDADPATPAPVNRIAQTPRAKRQRDRQGDAPAAAGAGEKTVNDSRAGHLSRTYTFDWFVDADQYDTITEPETITSGSDWDMALATAKKNPNKHPIGVHNLDIAKCRDSEGTMLAYLRFDSGPHFRQWVLTDALGAMRPFLVFKAKLGNVDLPMKQFNQTLDDLERADDDTKAAFKRHRGNDMLARSFMSPNAPDGTAIDVMLNAVHATWLLIGENPARFDDAAGPGACLQIAREDWMRAYMCLQFITKKLIKIVTSKSPQGSGVSRPRLNWGNPHAGEAARPVGIAAPTAGDGDGDGDGDGLGDGDGDGDGDGNGRGAQVMANVTMAEAAATLRAQLEPAATPARPPPAGRDDAKAKANQAYETITTALITSAGYPKNIQDGLAKRNEAPLISRQQGAQFIAALGKRLNIVPGSDLNMDIEALLAAITDEGFTDAVRADADAQNAEAAALANAVDTTAAEDAAALDAALLGDDTAAVKPAVTRSTVLTNEATQHLCSFEDAIAFLEWEDRLPTYRRTHRVPIRAEDRDAKAPALARGFGLTAGQIVDIGTMQDRLSTVMGAVILANEAGAGKTFAMLGNILVDGQRATSGLVAGPYFPSMIIVPSNLCTQYVYEFRKSFMGELQMGVWYGSDSTQDRQGKRDGLYIGKAVEDLRAWYESVGTDDPTNAKRFVVTSYETFYKRAGRLEKVAGVRPGRAWKCKLDDLQWATVYLDEGHQVKNPKSIVGHWLSSRLIDFDKVVICTATPLINSFRDLYGLLKVMWDPAWEFEYLHEILAQSKFDFRSFYGAPHVNPFAYADRATGKTYRLLDEAVYREKELYRQLVQEMRDGRPWHRLYPRAFYEAAERFGAASWFGPEVLAPILRLVQVRRLLSTPIWDGERHVVAEIPAATISTLQVDFESEAERRKYFGVYSELIPHLYIPGAGRKKEARVWATAAERRKHAPDDFSQGTIDASVERQLRTITTHPELFHLIATDATVARMETLQAAFVDAMLLTGHQYDYPAQTNSVKRRAETDGARKAAGQGRRQEMLGLGNRTGGTVEDLALIRDADPSRGLVMLFLATNREPRCAFPSTERLSVLYYVLSGSPKMRTLLVRIWQICREPQYDEDVAAKAAKRKRVVTPHKRVLVYFGSPMTQAIFEAVLDQFGVVFRALRAEMTDAERTRAIDAFKDTDNAVEVLVTSSRLSSQGLNLQDSCHHLILVEPPPTINMFIQIMARIVRLGQKHECTVQLLFLHESFDDFAWARAMEKHVIVWQAESALRERYADSPRALQMIGAELARAHLGLPYVPFQLARTSPEEATMARKFCLALRGRLHLLVAADAARTFDEDLARAQTFRTFCRSTMRRWAKPENMFLAPAEFRARLLGLAGTVLKMRAPFLVNEFSLTADPGALNKYGEPDDCLEEDGVLHLWYEVMAHLAKRYFVDDDDTPDPAVAEQIREEEKLQEEEEEAAARGAGEDADKGGQDEDGQGGQDDEDGEDGNEGVQEDWDNEDEDEAQN